MMSELILSINNMGLNSIVLGLSLLACFVSLFVLLRGHQRTQTLNEKLQRLEHELRVANGSAIGMGQQLISFEKQLNQQQDISASQVQYKEPLARNERPLARDEQPLARNKKPLARDEQPLAKHEEPLTQYKEPSQYKKSPSEQKKPFVHNQKQTETFQKNNDVDAQSVYDQARKSLSKGVDVGDVAKQCGLSFAEVSLLKSLSKSTITSP